MIDHQDDGWLLPSDAVSLFRHSEALPKMRKYFRVVERGADFSEVALNHLSRRPLPPKLCLESAVLGGEDVLSIFISFSTY